MAQYLRACAAIAKNMRLVASTLQLSHLQPQLRVIWHPLLASKGNYTQMQLKRKRIFKMRISDYTISEFFGSRIIEKYCKVGKTVVGGIF